MITSTSTSLLRPLGLLLLAAIALAGCADGEVAEASPEPDTVPAVADAATGADDGAIEVGLVDYAFTGLPSTVAPGTRLSVVNEAEAELHELVAFRLPDDEERSVADLAQLPPDELQGVLGEPATVLLAAPGGPEIPAVGDGTLTEPGRYAIICFIPTGADPQAYLDAAAESDEGPPQVEGGPPHIVHGMYAELTVR